MKIAVMGYGTIGSGVVEVLEVNKKSASCWFVYGHPVLWELSKEEELNVGL